MFCDGELNVLGNTVTPLYYFSLYFFLLIVFLACRTAAMKQLNESLLLKALQGAVKALNNKGLMYNNGEGVLQDYDTRNPSSGAGGSMVSGLPSPENDVTEN